MDIFKDFSLLIILGGAVQGVILGWVLILFDKKVARSNRLLAVLLFLTAYSSFVSTLFYSQYLLKVPHLLSTQSALTFLAGPTFYFYLKSLKEQGFKFTSAHFFHLIPFIAFVVLVMPFYLKSSIEKTLILNEIYNGGISLRNTPFNKDLFHTGLLLQTLYYSFYILRELFNTQETRSPQLSIIRAFSIFWLLVMSMILGRYLLFYDHNTSFIIPVMLSFGIYSLAYWSLIRQGFFFHVFQSNTKYRKSNVKPEKAQQLSKKLVTILETENIYRDPELTAPKLASRISISNHTLSQIINEELNDNFYSLINRLRVDDAKEKLSDSTFQHLSIEGIGYEAGFKSKSAFYSAFKKFTGQTPSEFRSVE